MSPLYCTQRATLPCACGANGCDASVAYSIETWIVGAGDIHIHIHIHVHIHMHKHTHIHAHPACGITLRGAGGKECTDDDQASLRNSFRGPLK